MTEPKKLIEVAMPVKEVSAESVRDKSIRHGHISTLHLWWARRPLPVSRAVVFASLVPDPDDPHCPVAFKQAVAKYLADKKYKPYEDIPHTAAIDPMEDNLRNRLLMFIGKFSDEYVTNEKAGKNTPSKNQLSDGSLIKWENKNNSKIIGIARKLIFIAHQTSQGPEVSSPESGEIPIYREKGKKPADLLTLEQQYNNLWNAILSAENNLYSTPDRHIETDDVKTKEKALHDAIENYLDQMPKVFDPFAGGGAIPLEAARLGCRTFGNDLNPVAHIIQRGSVEFPQKYGKPITYTCEAFLKQYPAFAELQQTNTVAEPKLNYGSAEKIELEGYEDAVSKYSNILNSKTIVLKNRLAFDVEYYARQMLAGAEKEIGQYYPEVNEKKPIAYYWARVGTCNNPSCKEKVPLLGSFDLCQKPGKNISLKPIINEGIIDFEIINEQSAKDGWVQKKNLICPHCGNTTSKNELKQQFVNQEVTERLIAVIEEGENEKKYRLPVKNEFDILHNIPDTVAPSERIVEGDSRNLWLTFWGATSWGQMFTPRQLLAMQTFINQLEVFKEVWKDQYEEMNDYNKAISTYLGILINRLSSRLTSFGLWHNKRETFEQPFGRQAIPMVFDFPESNPFCSSSGSALNQIDWLIRYISNENIGFPAVCNHTSSGENNQFPKKSLTAVITDPPYYDAIAYADLSDFFYVWLKRTLGNVFPFNFATPQTPKNEECTALKHHHHNNLERAKKHFESKLNQIFSAIEQQTSGIVSIMFAHQSTEA